MCVANKWQILMHSDSDHQITVDLSSDHKYCAHKIFATDMKTLLFAYMWMLGPYHIWCKCVLVSYNFLRAHARNKFFPHFYYFQRSPLTYAPSSFVPIYLSKCVTAIVPAV